MVQDPETTVVGGQDIRLTDAENRLYRRWYRRRREAIKTLGDQHGAREYPEMEEDPYSTQLIDHVAAWKSGAKIDTSPQELMHLRFVTPQQLKAWRGAEEWIAATVAKSPLSPGMEFKRFRENVFQSVMQAPAGVADFIDQHTKSWGEMVAGFEGAWDPPAGMSRGEAFLRKSQAHRLMRERMERQDETYLQALGEYFERSGHVAQTHALAGMEGDVARVGGQAIGSLSTFAAAGAMGGMPAITALGMALGEHEARQEAKAEGATAAEQGVAGLIGAAGGTIEAFPFLPRWNRLSPLTKSRVVNAATFGLIRPIPEGLQEVVQGVISRGGRKVAYGADVDVFGPVGEEFMGGVMGGAAVHTPSGFASKLRDRMVITDQEAIDHLRRIAPATGNFPQMEFAEEEGKLEAKYDAKGKLIWDHPTKASPKEGTIQGFTRWQIEVAKSRLHKARAKLKEQEQARGRTRPREARPPVAVEEGRPPEDLLREAVQHAETALADPSLTTEQKLQAIYNVYDDVPGELLTAEQRNVLRAGVLLDLATSEDHMASNLRMSPDQIADVYKRVERAEDPRVELQNALADHLLGLSDEFGVDIQGMPRDASPDEWEVWWNKAVEDLEQQPVSLGPSESAVLAEEESQVEGQEKAAKAVKPRREAQRAREAQEGAAESQARDMEERERALRNVQTLEESPPSPIDGAPAELGTSAQVESNRSRQPRQKVGPAPFAEESVAEEAPAELGTPVELTRVQPGSYTFGDGYTVSRSPRRGRAARRGKRGPWTVKYRARDIGKAKNLTDARALIQEDMAAGKEQAEQQAKEEKPQAPDLDEVAEDIEAQEAAEPAPAKVKFEFVRNGVYENAEFGVGIELQPDGRFAVTRLGTGKSIGEPYATVEEARAGAEAYVAEKLVPEDRPGKDEIQEMNAFAPSLRGIEDQALAFVDLIKDKLLRTPPITEDGVHSTKGWRQATVDMWVNKMAPLDRTIKQLITAGGTVVEDANAFLHEKLRKGKTKFLLDQLDVVKNRLFDIMAGADLSFNEPEGARQVSVNDYAMARHAPYANEVLQKRLIAAPKEKISREMKKEIARLEKKLEDELRIIDRELAARRRTIRLEIGDPNTNKDAAKAVNRAEQEIRAKLDKIQQRIEDQIEESWAEGVSLIEQLTPELLWPSGMSNVEAQEIMDKVEGSPKREVYEEIGRIIDETAALTRENWVETGLESRATVNILAKMYPHYVPLMSDLDELEGKMFGVDAESMHYGRGLNIMGREFQAALGRRTKAANPVANLLAQAEHAIVRGQKNLVTQKLLRMVLDNSDLLKDVVKIIHVPKKRRLVNGRIVDGYDPKFRIQDDIVTVKVMGAEWHMQFAKPYISLAKTLKNMGAADMHSVMHLASRANRFMAGMLTRFNIFFLPYNAMRDVGGAHITNREHGAEFAWAVSRNTWKAAKALRGQGPWAHHVEEFRRMGGEIVFLDLNNLEDRLRKMEKELHRMKRGKNAKSWTDKAAQSKWLHLGRLTREYNDIAENMSRLSTYILAQEMLGKSKNAAAAMAKEVTTNFETKGIWGPHLNGLYMFANAGIQGTRRVLQAMGHKEVVRFLSRSWIAAMFWDSLNRMWGGEDEDGVPYWDKLPEYTRRNHMVFMIPGTEGDHIAIPLPWVYSWIWSHGQSTGALITQNMGPGEYLMENITGSLDAANPLGTSVTDFSGGAAAEMMSPSLTDPLVQLINNREWNGRPIWPAAYGGRKPFSERFWPDASSVSRSTTRWLNSLTTGDEFEPGWLSISPEVLDHLGNFLMIGPFNELLRLSKANLIDGMSDGEQDVLIRNVPLVRRFWRKPSPYRSQADYRETVTDLRRERDRADAQGYRMDPDLSKLLNQAKRLDRFATKERKELDAMPEGSAEKRQRERVLDRKRQAFNKRYWKAITTSPIGPRRAE
jgi:hypothetical protein